MTISKQIPNGILIFITIKWVVNNITARIKMTKVIIYGSFLCPYCFIAKRTLKRLGVSYKEIRINKSSSLMREMINKSGRFTAPQFFIDDEYIGGYGDLVAQAKSGELVNSLVVE